MKMKVETRMMQPQAKECSQHQKLEEAMNGFPPTAIQRECGPDDTLISDSWSPKLGE